ncbi:MAG TPA: DUF1614 domain-containing protein, partial [Mycobacterium sp.]|nr:DUF1614 domain-containing protein [Mycobacterium sp.]
HFTHLHYLPLTLPFFSGLVLLVAVLAMLFYLRVLGFAYERLGIGRGAVFLLLIGSLAGSYFNIPVAELPAEHVVAGRVVSFFGMRYVVPVLVEWPGTVIAVNVGGAVIPGAMSLFLLIRHRLWLVGALATVIVMIVCHWVANPVPGLGIAMPVFVPALVTGVVALMLARERAAPLAYISGSLGTLIGADLLNLGAVRSLGAPIASIGGAGTFDGIFLVGILAVVIASLGSPGAGRRRSRRV